MADEELTARPVRLLLNFVSEEQLEDAKKTRGERVEDGTAQRDKPLHEILNDNKARKKAELNDRRKHKPPKSLDEDEVQFLDEWEMHKREKEWRLALEEAQELQRFRAAVATRCLPSKEITVPHSSATLVQQQRVIGRKNPAFRPLSSILKVVPLAKKAKSISEKSPESVVNDVGITSLVSYGSDSEDED